MSAWLLSALFLCSLPAHSVFAASPPTHATAAAPTIEATIGHLGQDATLSPKQTKKLLAVAQQFIQEDEARGLEAWKALLTKLSDYDLDALVLFVIREAYLEYAEDLFHFTGKVTYFNRQVAALDDQITAMQEGLKEVRSAAGKRANREVVPGPNISAPATFTEGAEPIVFGEELALPLASWPKEIKRWKKLRERAKSSAAAAATELHGKLKKRKKLYERMIRVHAALYAAAPEA